MHRQGISPSEQAEAAEIIKKSPALYLEGTCSHFADADNADDTYTQKQISTWNKSVAYFRAEFPTLKYWHISASAGHIYKQAEANLTRLGIGLYGLINIAGLNLRPVLEMNTMITSIKKIHRGDRVGYGGTFTAPEDMTIATIPVGYYEGVDRRLSNIGFMKLGETECPIVGRVSMNITTIDVSKIPHAKIGDKIIVISRNKNDKNSVENIAKLCGIISYEIAVYVPSQLRRVVID
jgi:alanine racemase